MPTQTTTQSALVQNATTIVPYRYAPNFYQLQCQTIYLARFQNTNIMCFASSTPSSDNPNELVIHSHNVLQPTINRTAMLVRYTPTNQSL